jgi:predicted nucleic acid-binding protein
VRIVFADTVYWVALLVPGDQWRARAIGVTEGLVQVRILTAQEVLVELLNFVAGVGDWTRRQVAEWVDRLPDDPDISVITQSEASFRSGLELYKQRPDKGYSLTDCVCMQAMRDHGIAEILTHDHHFRQEGFIILL